jgi:hypothetical protein
MQAIDRSARPGAGSERSSEVHSEELAGYKKLATEYEHLLKSSLDLIDQLIVKNRELEIKTAKQCAGIASEMCWAEHAADAIKKEFRL